MKELILSSPKYGKHIILLNDEDFDEVKQHNWNIRHQNGTFYVSRHIWKNGKRTTQDLHKFLMNTSQKEIFVDHKDGNGLNNQRSNLRFATRSQNNVNKRMQKNNTSGYRGVKWHKQAGYWEASIQFQGRNISLGLFFSKEIASLVYEMEAKKVFGEFYRDLL